MRFPHGLGFPHIVVPMEIFQFPSGKRNCWLRGTGRRGLGGVGVGGANRKPWTHRTSYNLQQSSRLAGCGVGLLWGGGFRVVLVEEEPTQAHVQTQVLRALNLDNQRRKPDEDRKYPLTVVFVDALRIRR